MRLCKKHLLLFVLSLFLMAGCNTTSSVCNTDLCKAERFLASHERKTEANYKKMLNRLFFGESTDALYDHWGTPNRHEEHDGYEFYEYIKVKNLYIPGTSPSYRAVRTGNIVDVYTTSEGTRSQTFDFYCRTIFRAKDGIIIDWQYEGNNCRR